MSDEAKTMIRLWWFFLEPLITTIAEYGWEAVDIRVDHEQQVITVGFVHPNQKTPGAWWNGAPIVYIRDPDLIQFLIDDTNQYGLN